MFNSLFTTWYTKVELSNLTPSAALFILFFHFERYVFVFRAIAISKNVIWCWNPAIVMLLTSCFVDCVDVWWSKTEKPDNFFSFLLFFPLYVCTCAPHHRRFFVLHVTCLLPTNGRRCLLAAFRRSLIWLVPGQNTGGPSSPNEVEGKHNSSYQLVVSNQVVHTFFFNFPLPT